MEGTMVPAVEIVGLKKSYLAGTRFWTKRRQIEALSGLDLAVAAGEIFGLVGRNGYGKTTLIKCVAGLLLPSAGQVRVFGHDTKMEGGEVRKLIGLVGAEERSFYLRLTSRQNLMFFARLQGMKDDVAQREIDRLACMLDCDQYLDRRVHELSTGNRQRISIVRGLLHSPRLLILDEPTRSLDPFAASDLRKILMDWVRESKERSILITSHHLHEIESMSDRIGIMGKGRLGRYGTLERLRSQLGARQDVIMNLNAPLTEELRQRLMHDQFGVVMAISEDKQNLSFRRVASDDCLDRVLAELVSSHVSIASINTREMDLQDLIDELEHVTCE